MPVIWDFLVWWAHLVVLLVQSCHQYIFGYVPRRITQELFVPTYSLAWLMPRPSRRWILQSLIKTWIDGLCSREKPTQAEKCVMARWTRVILKQDASVWHHVWSSDWSPAFSINVQLNLQTKLRVLRAKRNYGPCEENQDVLKTAPFYKFDTQPI